MSFTGIGLGPGDPDLITLKAVKALQSVDVVITATSKKTGKSYALEIAKRHINPSSEIVEALFPMTGDKVETDRVYLTYVELVKKKIDAGKRVGFLCIGDPLFHGTYGRLVQLLREKYPNIPVSTVPGIPAFCAAASCKNCVLALENEILSIVPANEHQSVERAAEVSDRLVIMKLYRSKKRVIESLRKQGYTKNPLNIEKAGFPGEYTSENMEEIEGRDPTYLSLLFVDRE